MWQAVLDTLADEFADVDDVSRVTRIVLRLFLAALLGGLLGFQRERHGKAAGARTHMLVALGAALAVLVPEQAGVTSSGMTRVIQGVVVGVGFLGAGSIVKSDGESGIQGLTTAAGIWLTAAVGIACGFGREATAVLAALLALAILAVVPHIGQVRDD
jgi:putative Mg2+ transporter-C (MgtC) family protein